MDPTAPSASGILSIEDDLRASDLIHSLGHAPTWTFLRKDPFLLLHDRSIDPEWISDFLRESEAVLADMRRELPAEGLHLPLLTVRICKDEAQYHQVGGSVGTVGFWSGSGRESATWVDMAARKDRSERTALLAYPWIRHAQGCVEAPPWFTRGVAEYYAARSVVRDGRLVPIRSGRMAADLRGMLSLRAWTPLGRFLGMGRSEFVGPSIRQHAAQSWSLVEYLMRDGSDGAPSTLRRFHDALRNGSLRRPGTDGTGGRRLSGERNAALVEEAMAEVFGEKGSPSLAHLEAAWIEWEKAQGRDP